MDIAEVKAEMEEVKEDIEVKMDIGKSGFRRSKGGGGYR